MPLVDLNSTLGESFGIWQRGMDDAMLRIVSSGAVACGFHAGDPIVMQAAVASARRAGVSVGATIGYPDLQGYGQRDINMTPYEIYVYALYQIGALSAICQANNVKLDFVKPHGALYRRASAELAVAKSIACAIRDTDKSIVFLGQNGTCFERAAADVGLTFAGEVFADRGYREDGSLIPSGERGDVVTDPVVAADRMLRLLKEGVLLTSSGATVPMKVSSIGIHGSYAGSTKLAFALKEVLEANSFTISGLRKILKSWPSEAPSTEFTVSTGS
ncbi:MAG: 5-oxoprolinase subunit PxpA [Synergistaceae bacterium]|jgi:UPF0271 protein|nr:5-oxoprolinase subunit PxpA [Synergistaceae bacterium]